jgi:hypothetical protein
MAPQNELIKKAEEIVEEVIRNLRRINLWTCVLCIRLLLTIYRKREKLVKSCHSPQF